jgi:hypothetical protein
MDEKVIIQSKISNVKLIRNIIWIIGAIVSILVPIWYAESRRFQYERFDNYIYDMGEYLEEVFSRYGILFFAIAVVVTLIIGFVFYHATNKITLTITDKRVYGTALFGKRVDLPFDMISAVGTSIFKGIAVATSSGTIKFAFMENRDSLHDEISKQLVIRQSQNSNKGDTVIKQEIPQSNADELKKYKDLLDMGVITQEEFDAKKKQLLGL